MSTMKGPDFSFPRSTGQLISVAIAAYMCIKPVFNFLVLGGSLKPLAIGLAALFCFLIGLKYSNRAIAVVLMLVACTNMINNLRLIGFNQFLTTEPVFSTVLLKTSPKVVTAFSAEDSL